jgi:hypothetical protein
MKVYDLIPKWLLSSRYPTPDLPLLRLVMHTLTLGLTQRQLVPSHAVSKFTPYSIIEKADTVVPKKRFFGRFRTTPVVSVPPPHQRRGSVAMKSDAVSSVGVGTEARVSAAASQALSVLMSDMNHFPHSASLAFVSTRYTPDPKSTTRHYLVDALVLVSVTSEEEKGNGECVVVTRDVRGRKSFKIRGSARVVNETHGVVSVDREMSGVAVRKDVKDVKAITLVKQGKTIQDLMLLHPLSPPTSPSQPRSPLVRPSKHVSASAPLQTPQHA